MAPPANNNFASAIALSTTLPGSRIGDTTVDATSQVGEPLSATAVDTQSVWYTFTPSVTGRYRFSIDNVVPVGTDFRHLVLGVYTGSAVNALTLVRECFLSGVTIVPHRDRTGIVVNLASGTTYRIQVASALFSGDPSNAHVSTFDLIWDSVATGGAPANDDIANVQDLGTDPADGGYTGSTIDATAEAFEIANGYPDPSVWFRFDCGGNETQEFNVVKDGDPDYFPYFEIYEITSDPPADLTDLNFVDGSSFPDADNGIAQASVALVNGTSYAIMVTCWDTDVGQQDDFILWFGTPTAPPSAPVNDDIGDAPTVHPYILQKSEWGDYQNWPESKGSRWNYDSSDS